MLVGTIKAASLLGICTQRVRQLLSEGRIKGAIKVGRFWQIPLFQGMPKIIPGRRGPKGTWKKRPQRTATYIHVKQQTVRKNRKENTREPVIMVRRGNRNQCCHEVEIPGPCKLVYEPDNPKPCGATLWIEVASTMEVITKVFAPVLT